MVIQSEVIFVIEQFNATSKGVRAQLVGSTVTNVDILFVGSYCVNCPDNEAFPAFREMLEKKTTRNIAVRSAFRVGAREIKVSYTISEEDPAEHIIKILGKYEEGAPARDEGVED